MPGRSAPRVIRLRSGRAGAAGGPARSPGGRRHPILTCATAAIRGRRRSARPAGKPGRASGSPRAARSAAAAGPVLPGGASGAGATGRSRPSGPAGPVCAGCYEHVRRHPAECVGCGVVRPLIGSSEEGRPVCGPCAGAPGLDYTCRECGRGGEIHSSRRCFRCVLAERPQPLLASPGGESPPSFFPCSRRSPRSPTQPPW
jgi:hypothetical protein